MDVVLERFILSKNVGLLLSGLEVVLLHCCIHCLHVLLLHAHSRLGDGRSSEEAGRGVALLRTHVLEGPRLPHVWVW